MKTKRLKVAIILPAYNEGQAIRGVVEKLQAVFKGSKYDFQIVVIEDGSRDDTAKQARLGGAYVIQHILNAGSGGATATGLSYAYQNGFDIASTSDADGQHAPEDVKRGIDLLSKGSSDLLIGSRLIDKKGMSRTKILGNMGLSIITNILFGVRVTDSQSGLRIFSRTALEKLKWKTSGYEFCSEMLWRARQQGLHISEYPIKAIYTDYSTSHTRGQNNWNGVNILKSLLRRRIVEMFE
jgi:glycosyltransferase involved in cell wall biosynthesis